MFGTTESLWKLFYYSPKKAEALIEWSEASLIITLDNLYIASGNAEVYGLSLVLSSSSGIATVYLPSAVLNWSMQGKSTYFSRLPIILDSIRRI